MTQNKKCRDIVIVGGGSAGWLLACRLAKTLLPLESDYTVSLIESPNIKTIGVGEGTWPTMRRTLQSIGLSETEFMRCANVSLKQGTRFNGWRNGGKDDYYFHPFEPPIGSASHNVGEIWRSKPIARRENFSMTVAPQETACLSQLAPKSLKTPEYKSVLNYGYHLDAGAFGELLATFGISKLGVKHIKADVIGIDSDENGWIDALRLNNSESVKGDLFFDCTGFRSLLMNKHMGVCFEDLDKYLFVDSALIAQVPYNRPEDPIASATLSTAHEAGWIWDIGLPNRRGVGLVYSKNHLHKDRAAQILSAYLGDHAMEDYRSITFKARRLQRMWQKNAVGVGLSAGFVEPLEASALMLIETVADWFCHRIPESRGAMIGQSAKFNEAFHGYWDRIIDFLKFHYVLSERSEPFWMDNRCLETIPDSLLENMKLWRDSVPFAHDFRTDSKIFSWESYQYVYLGMRSFDSSSKIAAHSALDEEFELNKRICSKISASMPSNRELVNRIASAAFPQQ